ncbi:MAG: ACT domain-containing protein [Chloroflexia bacterium]
MPIETALRIHLPNRRGELARVARQLANAGVNIRTIAGLTVGNEGTVELLVDDPARASQALKQAGANFEQARVIVSPIPSQVRDTPGTLAQLADILAEAGINIESLYTTAGQGGQLQGVLGCDNPEKAEPLLASWGKA